MIEMTPEQWAAREQFVRNIVIKRMTKQEISKATVSAFWRGLWRGFKLGLGWR